MKFTPTDPNIDVDLLNWRSDTGRFELGMSSVLYGVRVVLSYPKGYSYELNYCIERDSLYIFLTFQAIRRALLDFDECCDLRDIRKRFPAQTIKPMRKDTICFQQLLELGHDSLRNHPNPGFEQIDWKKKFDLMDERFQSRITRTEALIQNWKSS